MNMKKESHKLCAKKYKLMKKLILFVLVLTTISVLNSCSKSNELAPKTGDINSEYLLPKGTLLSAEDRDAIDKRLTEYNDATGL